MLRNQQSGLFLKGVFSFLTALLLSTVAWAQTAIISSPLQNDTLSNVYVNGGTSFNVTGTATGSPLNNWTLDYGSGTAPSTWTTISTGTTPVTNGLLGAWNTKPSGTLLGNGTYTIRLRVWNTTGNPAQALVTVFLKHFKASQNVMEFNGFSGSTVTYTSTVPFTLTETLEIRNQSGQLVRTIVSAVQRTESTYNDLWNGRNDANQLLPDGAYFYKAIVTTGTYTMTWDLTNEFVSTICSGSSITYTPFDPYDNVNLTFTYNYTTPRRITVRFYNCNQYPFTVGCNQANCSAAYSYVLDKYVESGPHTIRWAGVDPTGAFRRELQFGKYFGRQDAFSKNAVVLFGSKPVITNPRADPPVFNPAREMQEISFDLAVSNYQSQLANITISVYNQNTSPPSILKTISTSLGGGHIGISWNGKDDTNQFWLAPGYYLLRVRVLDSIIGNEITEDILTTIRY